MSEAHQPRHMQCRYQDTRRNSGRFDRIVVFNLATIGQSAVLLQENRDQVRRGLKKWFVRVSTKWLKCGQPLCGGTVLVELLFFDFGSYANLLFCCSATDYRKMPRLQVSATGRRPPRPAMRFQ